MKNFEYRKVQRIPIPIRMNPDIYLEFSEFCKEMKFQIGSTIEKLIKEFMKKHQNSKNHTK